MPPSPRRRSRPHRPTPSDPTPRPPARPAPIALRAADEPGPGTERRLWAFALAACGLAGVALLAMVLGPHRIGDYMTETDFYGQYAAGARLVQHGRLDPSRYGVIGPAYEIVLAAVGFVVRNLFLAAGLVSVAAATGALLLWAALLRARAGAGAALAGVLFVATNGTFFRYGYSVTTDALALGIEAAALFVLLARPGARAPFWAGLLAALAFLTRYTAGVLLPAGLLAIALGAAPGARRGRAALAFALGFLVPLAPWVAWSYARGTGISFQLHHNIAYEVFARSKGIAWDTYQRTMQSRFHGLGDVIAADPGAVFARMAGNVFDHLGRDAGTLLGGPVAASAVLGIALGIADGRARRLWPLWLAWAFLFAALVPVFHSERYSLALLPFYAAAAGLLFTSPRFALALRRGPRLWLAPALALVPLGFAVAASVAVQARVLDQLPVEVLPAARTLRALARPGDRVIARKGHVSFYSGLAPVPFPFANTLPQLAAYARSHGARWLYFSWPEAETRPQFWFLLDTTAAVPGLTPHPVPGRHPAVLFEIGPAFGQVPAWAANDTLLALHDARAHALVDPAGWLRYGQMALAAGRLAEAREGYGRAAERRPRDVALLVALGKVDVRLGDLEGGLSAFERAEAVDPRNVDARVGHGYALLFSGRRREAAETWRPVVDRVQDSGTLQLMVGLYREMGDREAEERARAALAGGMR